MWLNKLEEKFGRYAIPNLPKIIVLLYAVGFVIANISPRLYSLLELNPYLILHGQVWRIVTFLLIGPETNLIFVIFVLLFYYSIGSSLEQVWGTFRFNMYYLIGVLGTIVGAFLTYAILTFAYGEGYGAFVNMDTFYLNMTLFLAYASMFPEMEVYLYMILKCVLRFPSQILLALLPQFSLLPRGHRIRYIKNNCADLCPCGMAVTHGKSGGAV